MDMPLRAARRPISILVAGVALVLSAFSAEAQRSTRRYGVAVDPQPVAPTIPYPGANVTFDPRWRAPAPTHTHRNRFVQRPSAAPVVVYVLPVPVGGGYHDGYGAYGYGAAEPRQGGVYDTNGRPLSSGFDTGPSAGAAPSYTPDLSGSPYVVIEGGAMLVDLPSGERRSVPSCAAQDPDGRPRTVFYQGGPMSVVLRAGQRGRVQGTPSPRDQACYTADSWGRVVLEY